MRSILNGTFGTPCYARTYFIIFPSVSPRFPPRLDDHLASVYARSPRVKKEFTDYHDNLRIAIGMARQMQVRIPAPPFPSYLPPFTCLSPFFDRLQDPLALVTLIYAAQDPRGGRFGGPGYQLSYLSLHDLQVSTFPSSISSLICMPVSNPPSVLGPSSEIHPMCNLLAHATCRRMDFQKCWSRMRLLILC